MGFLGRSTNGSTQNQCPFQAKLLMNLIIFAVSRFLGASVMTSLNGCIIGSSRALCSRYSKHKYQKMGHSDKTNSTSLTDWQEDVTECLIWNKLFYLIPFPKGLLINSFFFFPEVALPFSLIHTHLVKHFSDCISAHFWCRIAWFMSIKKLHRGFLPWSMIQESENSCGLGPACCLMVSVLLSPYSCYHNNPCLVAWALFPCKEQWRQMAFK